MRARPRRHPERSRPAPAGSRAVVRCWRFRASESRRSPGRSARGPVTRSRSRCSSAGAILAGHPGRAPRSRRRSCPLTTRRQTHRRLQTRRRPTRRRILRSRPNRPHRLPRPCWWTCCEERNRRGADEGPRPGVPYPTGSRRSCPPGCSPVDRCRWVAACSRQVQKQPWPTEWPLPIQQPPQYHVASCPAECSSCRRAAKSDCQNRATGTTPARKPATEPPGK